jgi:chemosensory pili system protein ChpA (sensor histidine kinase/response regulator)
MQNMLAEQNRISTRVAQALECMRTISAGELGTPDAVAEALRQYIRAIALVGMQAKEFGGAHDACVYLHRYFADIREAPRVLSPEERTLLAVWPDALAACLADPDQDSRAPLWRVMEACGFTVGTDETDLADQCAAAAMGQLLDPSEPCQAAKRSDQEGAEHTDAVQAMGEVNDALAPTPMENTDWTETCADNRLAEASEDTDPVSSLLRALEEIGAMVAEAGFVSTEGMTEDDVMRYAMTLMQIRDSAEAAGFGPLVEACDILSPVVANLMEARGKASPEEREALTGFAMQAQDLLAPPDAWAAEEDLPSPGDVPATLEAMVPDPDSISEPAAVSEEIFEKERCEATAAEDESSGRAIEPMAPAAPSLEHDAMQAEPQRVSMELLGLLTAELSGIGESMRENLPAATAADEPEARSHACEACAEIVERLGHASEAVGLVALSSVMSHLGIRLRAAGGGASAPDLGVLMPEVLGRIENYLATPTDASACGGLVDVLLDSAWAERLSCEEGGALAERLANVELVVETEQREARLERASAEDVSLVLPNDLNPALLENLLLELPQQVGAFTEAIGRIAAGGGKLSDVEDAKRAAHTLKGAANTVGVRGIASVTHHLEDILIAFSDHGVLPGRSMASLLLRSGDCLETMNEVLQGTGPLPEDALSVLQEILDCANRIDRDGLPDEEAIVSPVLAAQSESEPVRPQEAAEPVPMLRIPAPLIDELLRLVGESITANSQTQERLRLSINQAQAVKAQNRLLRQLVNELDSLVDIRGVAAPVRVDRDGAEFDALEMEQYSELHTVTSRLIEAVTDAHEISAQSEDQLSALGDVLDVQSRLQSETQEAVMRTRMVRVETIVPRLHRGVRQTARLLDKSVTLEVKGQDTLIDGDVLNDLVDPLMHVLRNAVDHGIEDADARRANGKDPTGHIELSFVREGNSIVVRCRDDGHGLNLETIRASAMERGLINAANVPSDDELARLILVPGFSTRNEATQISGRGIGMDMVNSRVLELKGSLALHSDSGHGLNVEIRIPLSMLSTHALLVRIRERRVALSTRNVEDIHFVTPGQVKQVGLQWHYQVNDVVYDVVRLDALLNWPGDRRAATRTGFPLLLVRQSDGSVRAVQVQEIIDSRNLVMKSLGQYVPAIKGVAGAAILGDGSVVPVVDLPDLLRATVHLTSPEEDMAVEGHNLDTRRDLARRQTALVVDDSLSARRATAQVMKDAGFAVRTAIDGLEAVTILGRFVPDIILADMEMPRMNGLELTSHVRSNDRTRDVPVIMITSRSTEKHRKQAQAAGVSVYLTKPFNDEIMLQHVARLVGTDKP